MRRFTTMMAMAALLAGCGGGDGGSSPVAATPAATPTPTASATCSLRSRQDWAAAQLREWYLFPETLPTALDPTTYATVDSYIDALTATARAQRKDRFFTYLTSIAEEDAFYDSGSSAGLGVRLATDESGRRVFIAEAFEGAPALAAGIDRGTEIVGVGTSAADIRTVADIVAADPANGFDAALGPSTPGTTRVLRISDAAGTRDVSVTKAEYELTPVSSRYGARILDDGGRKVGYVNLRTFIGTADAGLRTAFAQFRSAGVTQLIVDLRYNGGGLVSIAELFTDLMGAARSTGEVASYTTFRQEKSAENETRFFRTQPQAIAPVRIAFIGTGGTASASEFVINAQIPYLRADAALVGTNTFGKPVGQIALDRAACDDRLRVIAFATQNAARQGAYYDGLAGTVQASCQATDDISRPLGDPREDSVARALDFLAGRPCTAIPGTTGASASAAAPSSSGPAGARTAGFYQGRAPRILMTPNRPSTAQREVPGLF